MLKRDILLSSAVLLILTGASASAAFAETSLPASPEMRGIGSVLDIIRNVNLNQTDIKANQSLLDILELKSQINPGKTAEPPAANIARPAAASNLAKRPAQRRLKKL